jgi:hypothetical protein
LAEKNKRFVEEACRYDSHCKNPRALLFCEDIWMGNLFLEFFKKENRDKKRRVNRVFFAPILWSRWTGDHPQADEAKFG